MALANGDLRAVVAQYPIFALGVQGHALRSTGEKQGRRAADPGESASMVRAMQRRKSCEIVTTGFGIRVGGFAHGAVSRRPPVSLDTMVPRTGGYACDVGVWNLSIVQGPFSVAPSQTISLSYDSQLLHRCMPPLSLMGVGTHTRR
jgi:hypothetical protein